MATFLYRLGRLTYRRRKVVAVIWLGILALVGIGGSQLAGETSPSFDIPGTPSQQAMDLLSERFPQMSGGGSTARLVFAAPEGQTVADPAVRETIAVVLDDVRTAPGVVSVADPFETGTIAQDGRIAFAEVGYDEQLPSAEAQEALVAVADVGREAGLTVEIGGEALQQGEEPGGTEIIGLAVAALVLVITFGSLIAAGLPLLTAILGIGVSISAITAATGLFDMSPETSILALMLGLAVSIDYALFIVSRYRHELAIGHDGEEAAGRAVGTAGSAVVFAGLTVMIALSGLSVVGIPMLTEMGLAAAFAVAMAVIIALTFLPALLGFAGRRIMKSGIPGLRARDSESDQGKPRLGLKWARLVTGRPIPVLIVTVLGMAALAIPAASIQLGLPDQGNFSEDTTQRRAYDLVSGGFGAGFNGPLTVVIDAAASAEPQAVGQQVAQEASRLDNVGVVTPPQFNPAGDTAVMMVIPQTGPSAAETEALVHEIRDLSAAFEDATDATVAVTGVTAITIDFSETMADALAPYLVVVVGLSLLLLLLVFRSILVPLKAAAGFLITMAATFGATVAVFQWGWGAGMLGVDSTGVIISMLPIFLIGVVFGLAMDYQVFLVTRMREEHVHGADATTAVVTGFQHGSRVVSAAAIIMISVFAGFILSGEDFIKQIGFAMAAAVAFDAFVVRMTIVPAVMKLLGERAWWLPRWLDRALPDVDVEGEKLRHFLDQRDEADLEPAAR